MKTFLLSLATLCFVLSGPNAYSQTDCIFEFTDGYFESSFSPAHLIHDGTKLDVKLAGEYYLWLDFKVKEDVVANPCSIREEQPCRVIHQIVQKNSGGNEIYVAGWKNGLEFRTDESVGVSIPATSVPRSTPFKNVFLVVKIVKDNKELFRKEWPVIVWP